MRAHAVTPTETPAHAYLALKRAFVHGRTATFCAGLTAHARSGFVGEFGGASCPEAVSRMRAGVKPRFLRAMSRIRVVHVHVHGDIADLRVCCELDERGVPLPRPSRERLVRSGARWLLTG